MRNQRKRARRLKKPITNPILIRKPLKKNQKSQSPKKRKKRNTFARMKTVMKSVTTVTRFTQ